jgi:4-hydroxy-tetrahydrodipicolinate synthase
MIKQTTGTDRRAFLQSLLLTGAAAGLAGSVGTRAFAAEPKSPSQLHGLYPIAFTPVGTDDKVDMDGLAAQVKFCQRGRVHGIAWPQIASGWSVLSKAERLEGAEVMLSAAKGGKTKVLIGVQSPEWSEVETYARHADQHGADAIICIPPAAITDEGELLKYYQRVGALTPRPLMIQAVGSMSIDLLVKIFETVPTARSVKDESGEPIDRVEELVRRTNGDMSVFSGRGVATMITEMERGFLGHCPYVSLSDIYAEAYDLWHAGKKEDAYVRFGAIQAANTIFSQSTPDVLIARGVFKPGTRTRSNAPQAQGANTRRMPANNPEEIKRILDTYLKPFLRA